jgi:photosystem II stability/assembly factor-like uncharacterized protein
VATSSVSAAVPIPAQLHKTEDGGQSWKDISGDAIPTDLRHRAGPLILGVAATRPATVYAGVPGHGISASTDGGASWHLLSLGHPVDPMMLTSLLPDPADPRTVYAAFVDTVRRRAHVLVTHDGGATWGSRHDGLAASGGWAMSVDPATNVLYAADVFGGLQSSTEGRPWKTLIRSQSPESVASKVGKVRFVPGAPSTVYTLLAGKAWKSADGGGTWSAFAGDSTSPLLNDLAFDPADPNRLYGVAGAGVFRSVDGGGSWVKLHGERANTVLLPRPGVILAGGCGIVQSSDDGRTWHEVLPCEGVSVADRREVEGLRSDAAWPNEVIAKIVHFGKRSVYRSRDGGTTWRPVDGTNALARDPHHPRTLFAAKGNDLARSGDGGETWSTISSLGGVGEIWDVIVDPTAPDTLYVVELGGLVSRSLDGGRTWVRLSLELHAVGLSSLVPHPTVPHLFYAAAGSGFYEVRLEP